MAHSKSCGLALTVVALCFLYSCGSTRHTGATHTGAFLSQPVVIDGNDSDWPSPYPNYDSKARISYAVANDHNNLYITLKASDRFIQRKIAMGGLTVWIDRTGKKEETAAIDYPLRQSGAAPATGEERPASARSGAERPPLRDSSHRRNAVALAANDYSLSGFGTCRGTFRMSDTATCGIRLRMNLNDYNELVWEAAVPLTVLYPGGAAAGRAVSVGFAIGGVPMPARDASHQGGGGHGGGMSMGGSGMGRGGGGHGGGMGGGMGRGGGGYGHGGGRSAGGEAGEDYESLSKASKTWITTGIAVH